MKTPSTKSPRLICRIVRWWAALTESPTPTSHSEPATGHRAHCPDCRAYFQSTAALEGQLRHTARTQISASPAGLEQRIAEAVRRAQVSATAPRHETHRASARHTIPLWAGGLATAAAVVALIVGVNREPSRTTATAEASPAEITAIFTAVTTLPQQLNKVFATTGAQPAGPDPLSHELDNVKADAQAALSFLAENFLPATREPTSSLFDRRPVLQGS